MGSDYLKPCDSTSSSKKSRKRRKSQISSSKPKRRKTEPVKPFRMTYSVAHKKKSTIYALQFNHFIKDRDIFACGQENMIYIYECTDYDEHDTGIKLLRVFEDPNEDQNYYALAWGCINSELVLACGGASKDVQVFSVNNPGTKEKHFLGHGRYINEMKFHPTISHLLLTASQDFSLRLWNVNTDVCVVQFSGPSGHRDEIVTFDFQVNGKYFISGGIDHCIKIWNLETEEINEAIRSSDEYNNFRAERAFPTLIVYSSDFTTREIHTNYIDSVKCFGSTFLSKSLENVIAWWKNGTPTDRFGKSIKRLHEFEIHDCDIWFMKLEIDSMQRYLAVGNTQGEILLFDLDAGKPPTTPIALSHYQSKCTVRSVSFSKNSSILIAVNDEGRIFRWDRKE